MENILLTIKQKLSSLSDAEQRVGKYILGHPNEVLQMNANELAEVSKSSPATVVRFSKSINESGFPKLKIKISSSMNNNEETIIQEIDPHDEIGDLKKKVEARISHTIQQSGISLNDEAIGEAINLIKKNTYIISYGISASGLVAQDFAQKFIRLGKNVINNYDTHLLSTGISAHKNDALLVLISNSGNTAECKNLLDLANAKGVKSIVISHSSNSYLAKNCSVFLEHNAGQEKEGMRTAATTSLIAQMYTTDLLYYSYFCLEYEKNLELIRSSSQSIKEYLGEK